MLRRQFILGSLLATTGRASIGGASPPVSAPSPEVLGKHLRNFVLQALPDPLFEDAKHWGMQKIGPRGKVKNDGRWHKLRLSGNNLSQELLLEVSNWQNAPGRTTFSVHVSFPAILLLERQTWALGLRLYSGSTRARVKIGIVLNCEVQTKIVKSSGWIPDMIVQFRILQSAFVYKDLVVEHTAGVGGDAAKLLGEMMISLVKAAKPNLDRGLSNKVNAAILKAGETKTVRISLTELIQGKKSGK